MKRWLRAFTLVAVFLIAGAQIANAQSATVAVSVTVLPSPLYVEIGPGCAFIVTDDAKTVDCVVSLIVGQATYEFEGWRASLKVRSLKDSTSGEKISAQSVSLVSVETFSLTWGQAIDPVGGPFVPGESLNSPLKHGTTIVAARPGFGNGGYRAVLHFRLQAPPDQAPGVYVPTWKFAVSNTFA